MCLLVGNFARPIKTVPFLAGRPQAVGDMVFARWPIRGCGSVICHGSYWMREFPWEFVTGGDQQDNGPVISLQEGTWACRMRTLAGTPHRIWTCWWR